MTIKSSATHITEEMRIGSLSDHFLIAMPSLTDNCFSEALIYICDHSKDGSMGLVINRPMDVPLSAIFEQMQLDNHSTKSAQPILSGGPVNVQRGFVLHSPQEQNWESTMTVSEHVSLTASRDILADIAAGSGPSNALVVLGYAGWGAGQLEQEIAENSWLTVPAHSDIIFHTPFEQRRRAAAASIGVDLHSISHSFGHA